MNIPSYARPSFWKQCLVLLLPPAAYAAIEMNSEFFDSQPYADSALITAGLGFALSLLLHALRFIKKVSDQADHPFQILARWSAIIGQGGLAVLVMSMGMDTDGIIAGSLFLAILLLALASWYVLAWLIRKLWRLWRKPSATETVQQAG
ncbi:hypothetical protein DLREEDagrD3_03980 [Denitratisoma sp. agr-D3]